MWTQILGQGLCEWWWWWVRLKGKRVESMYSSPSRASKDNPLCPSHLWMHHYLQHHSCPAANLLRSTRKSHEQPARQFPNPTSLTPSHLILDANLRNASLRDSLCTIHEKADKERVRYKSIAEDRCGTVHCDVLNGGSGISGEQEKKSSRWVARNHLHLLDFTSISHIWGVRDVHSCGSHWILLQTSNSIRNAILLDGHNLLLLLFWLLSQLSACFSCQQHHIRCKRWRVVE